MQITAQGLIEHINKYYDSDELLVTTIYSQADLYDVDPDKAKDLWIKTLADEVEGAMEYAQEILNNAIGESIPEEATQ